MTLFRIVLVAIAVTLFAYTAVVMAHHGPGLLPIFFGDMAAMTWPGQFNLDFLFLLSLAAFWIWWRHGLTASGFGLGLLVYAGGSLYLALYLLVVSRQAQGDARLMLLGPSRAAAGSRVG